jgi:hypothetical protein
MYQDNLSSIENKKNDSTDLDMLIQLLQKGDILVINPRRKNGLVLLKKYHGEFAGPGAVVGSCFDLDVVKIIPVGNLSLISLHNSEERRKAYLIRRQWIRLIKQITDNTLPLERAQMILNQFEHWFDPQTTNQLNDEAFALLVGVLPQTIKKARNAVERM